MKQFLMMILLLLVVSCDLNILPPSISVVSSGDHIVGRLCYISVKVTKGGFPLLQKTVKFQKLVGSHWEDLEDEISGQSAVSTDSDGIASIGVVFEEPGTYTIRAILLPENIVKVFNVHVDPVKWMFLMWFAADNDLYQYAVGDLEEMEGIQGDFSLRIVFDTPFPTDTICYLDDRSQLVCKDIEEINSGDGDILKLELMKTLSISSEYHGLVIWNHGNAWIYDNLYERIASLDDTSNDALTTRELKEAVKEALEASNTDKLDVLGMDACLMGSLEILYELRDVADYIVASASPEPVEGWNYRFLEMTSYQDSYNLCEKIVDYYFEDLPDEKEITLAVFDTSKVGQFIERFNILSSRILELFDEDPGFKKRFESYQGNLRIYSISPEGTERVLVDLGELLNLLKSESELSSYISQIPLGELIPYSKVSEDLEGLSGMSIFFPERNLYMSFIEDYYTLSFTEDTYWDDVLSSLYGE